LKRAIPVIGIALFLASYPPIHEGEKHIQFMMAVKLNARITASAQTVVISDIFKLLSIKTPSGSNVAYL
jgi:hypothetical protein